MGGPLLVDGQAIKLSKRKLAALGHSSPRALMTAKRTTV
jgi:hypothetical protein